MRATLGGVQYRKPEKISTPVRRLTIGPTNLGRKKWVRLLQGGRRSGAVLASNVFVRTKTACQGKTPETPDTPTGRRIEMIPFIIGMMFGGSFGVMIMCLVQINRDERIDDFQ